jgi:hypothetical protein
MKTPQVPALPGMTPLGIKPYAQVMAEKPLMAPAPQKPCDVGLFSDDAAQTDLVDLLRK